MRALEGKKKEKMLYVQFLSRNVQSLLQSCIGWPVKNWRVWKRKYLHLWAEKWWFVLSHNNTEKNPFIFPNEIIKNVKNMCLQKKKMPAHFKKSNIDCIFSSNFKFILSNSTDNRRGSSVLVCLSLKFRRQLTLSLKSSSFNPPTRRTFSRPLGEQIEKGSTARDRRSSLDTYCEMQSHSARK